MTIWNLDECPACNDARRYWAKIQNTKHPKFAVGEKIEFFTGYNDDIRAVATIKAISGDELYVYSDCYWYPIKDDQRRKIRKVAA
jgi:hypothetical protein